MESTTNDRPLLIAFWLMLGIALWSWSLSWNGSMLDSHVFRQTQTAITAHWIKEDGYHLDYETPLFGPPWSIPLEFPVYQWCVAQLSRATGLPLEQSGRATSVLFLLATLPAVYLLASLAGLSRPGRLLVVACVLSCPIYLYYGRSFMIETTALCFSTWFLAATGLAVRQLSLRWSVMAAICGTLAALVKVTTFALFGFPAAGLALWFCWTHWQSRRESSTGWWRAIVLGGIPVLIAAGIGEWWVRHADVVKDSNPFSHFLTSSELASWNWGTVGQRFSPAILHEFWTNLSQSVLGEPALAVLLVCLIPVAARCRRWAAVGAVAFLLGPLVFINLYYRHDYYYTANSLLLMLSAGLVLAGMWTSSLLPRGVKVMLLLVFFTSQLLTFYRGLGYNYRRELPPTPEIADVIHRTIAAEGVVLIYGWDWNSLIPYYSERRAILVPGGRENEFSVLDQILTNLPPRRITAMVVHRELFAAPAAFIQERAIRFGLAPTPFATSEDGDLYLPQEAWEGARHHLAGRKYAQVIFPGEQAAEPRATDRKQSDLSGIELDLVSPRSTHSSSQFGVSMGNIGKRPILNAHAPSEILINPPLGATHLIAEFGLHEGAYTGHAPFTDGIGVTISELRPESAPRIVFRRELDPVNKPEDRGVQKIELSGAGPFTGQLLFQFDPGPKGNIDKDWAYWARIEIR